MKKTLLCTFLMAITLLSTLAGCGMSTDGVSMKTASKNYRFSSLEERLEAERADGKMQERLDEMEAQGVNAEIIAGTNSIEYRYTFKTQRAKKGAEKTAWYEAIRDAEQAKESEYETYAKDIFKTNDLASLTFYVNYYDADGSELFSWTETYFR